MVYDFLIIGAGIAGLYAALSIPRDKKVLIVCKEPPWECNTFYAQGGISAAISEEDIPLHVEDTLKAGAGLCDKEAVEIMCRNSIAVVNDLIARGFEFDKDEGGNLLFTREAAHSTNRILHAGGDATGRYLHAFLFQNNPHSLLSGTVVTDLLVEDGVCYGATVCSPKGAFNIYANCTIIASGGVGSLYEFHTNARTISADLQGIAIEKGLAMRDMEMLQFHPTVYVEKPWARKFLLTEALRGEGALVVDETNRRFLFDYDERGELASRDVISRAIFKHKAGGHEVYLSFEPFSRDFFERRFPNIFKNLTELGFRVPEQKIPISPAFHYAIGGIQTDIYGRVAGMQNLYAVGEVASTRVHGANRLASNSLLEGLVFSKRAAADALSLDFQTRKRTFCVRGEPLQIEGDKERKDRLRKIMWQNVGIVRRRSQLEEALFLIEQIEKEKIGRFLHLRLLTAKTIVKSALSRRESLGAHYVVD